MRRDLVSTRIELDRQSDVDLRLIGRLEERSKRQMGRVLLRRVVHLWKTNPSALTTLQLIRPVVEEHA
jgi:hypothetical protein